MRGGNLDGAISSQTLKSLSEHLGGSGYSKDEDAEAEAGRLWDTLNQLSNNDPLEYQRFMANQLQHIDSSKDGEVTLNKQSASSAVPPFVPLHGFVVKTFPHSDGTQLFVNICHHETTVPKPIDGDGNEVGESHRNLEHLQIPLLVSKLRDCFDGNKKAVAVDVVVNSWVMNTCKRETSFKTDLVNLAVNSAKEEHSIKVEEGQNTWKVSHSKYKGGLGADGIDPRPFEDNQVPMSMTEQVTESPLDLLKCREEYNESQPKDRDLKMSPVDRAKKESTLIEEISSGTQPTNTKDSTSKKGPAIKSGFLNQRSNKKPLYPKGGSTGDGSSGTGGSYASLMSKCEVVDTQHMKTQPSIEQEFHETSMDTEIAQTLKDLSNVMSGTMAAKEHSTNNVTISTNNRKMTLQVDLSSCDPRINNMADLDLHMSEVSLILVAPQSNERWSVKFPKPVDVGSVSAKFRRKQHMLEIECLQK